MTRPSSTQIGGDHYSKYPIQPELFISENNLSWRQANIIKYAVRYKDKNGARDIAKAIHYAELILEREYGTTYAEVKEELAKEEGGLPLKEDPPVFLDVREFDMFY